MALPAVLCLLAAPGCGLGGGGLAEFESAITTGATAGKVGRPVNAGLASLYVKGDKPVKVTGVKVRLVDGLRLVGVWAHRTGNGAPMVGLLEGDLAAERPGMYDFRPVTEATLMPGPHPGWSIVISIAATRPGRFETEGLDISWRSGRRTGTRFYDFRVYVNATA